MSSIIPTPADETFDQTLAFCRKNFPGRSIEGMYGMQITLLAIHLKIVDMDSCAMTNAMLLGIVHDHYNRLINYCFEKRLSVHQAAELIFSKRH